MKRSLSLLISISGLCLLTACGGGTAPQATHFSVTAPATATAGTAFNFTVTALDASNRMTTNYSGTAHFTSNDGQAVLPANSMLTSGMGTFSATLKSAGAQSITAIDTVTASMTGTSSSINVAPGTASHFSVAAPGAANVGIAFNITVNALDAFNNTASSYSGTAHFTSTDGQAVLPANSMLTNGTGTFSVTPKTTGSQTITATDTITASITGTSSSISVTAAGPLAITSGVPPTGTVGTIYDIHFVSCKAGSLGCVCKGPPIPICLRRVPGFNFSATGGLAPYSWNWNPEAASSLPPGLNLLNGIISGTPTEAGSFNVFVTVTDSESPSVQKSMNYTIVINLPPPPVIDTMPAPTSGVVNVPYSFSFTATSGLQPLGWSETGPLPPGLSLSTGGVLAGTPTEVGSFPIIVTAQDSVGQNSAPQDFTIQIFAHGFAPTGTMDTARSAATATLLNTGKVLVAGGTDANGPPVATAELYDPSNGTFSPTGSMETARADFAATLLPNGKVLVTGGLDTSGNPLATAELYDPTTGTFSATTGNMQFVHASHTATLLNTGKVLVAGWGNATAELFDPATGTFTATGSMLQPRVSHTATLLNSGKVLLTGGIQGTPPATTVLAEAELYDPTTGSFSQTLGSLATARQWHTATLLTNGTVLVTGGFLDNNGNAIATAELFDLTSQSFTPTKGNMETPRAFQTATLLKDGTVLVTGGNNGTGPLATAELYDPTAGTFSPTGSMGAARQSHTATLLNDGTVLVTGGTNGAPLASAERYQ